MACAVVRASLWGISCIGSLCVIACVATSPSSALAADYMSRQGCGIAPPTSRAPWTAGSRYEQGALHGRSQHAKVGMGS